ncbi:MAG: DUF1097 domain-containing protein [Bacteroidota bacterium]
MKTFIVAIIFGLFGAVAVSISFAMAWPTWVMFIAWVSYYLFGKTVLSSLKAFMQIGLGILMGVLIQITGGALGKEIGALGFPIAVFFFIGSLAYFARTKTLNNIPAWFLGLIVVFGVHPPLTPLPILQLAIPLFFGFLFAWLNDSAVEKVHTQKANHSNNQNH